MKNSSINSEKGSVMTLELTKQLFCLSTKKLLDNLSPIGLLIVLFSFVLFVILGLFCIWFESIRAISEPIYIFGLKTLGTGILLALLGILPQLANSGNEKEKKKER